MTTTPQPTNPIDTPRGIDPAERYGHAMSKVKVGVAVLALWIASMFVQTELDKTRKYYNPTAANPKSFVQGLRDNMFGASMLGFREVAAGMLWVKADELFHEGKYTELVPYFSLVTFMDPHQIDVYSTGAWHLLYNFQDSRMVTQGLAFLEQGVKNNPSIWDLYFQMGWNNFDWPVESYEAAYPWLKQAATKKGTDGSPAPRFVDHLVGHALSRQGRVQESLDQWQRCIDYAEAELVKAQKEKDTNMERYWQQERDISRNNFQLVLVRSVARGDIGKNPLPLSMDVNVKRIAPRTLRLTGKINNLPVLRDMYGEIVNARVEVRLEDKNYNQLLEQHKDDLAWIPENLTRFRSIYNIVDPDGTITNGRDKYVDIDLVKDPADLGRTSDMVYPLKSDEFDVVVRFDPRVRRQPEAVQATLGWVGEGLKKGPDVVEGPNGSRALEKRITFSREQIL